MATFIGAERARCVLVLRSEVCYTRSEEISHSASRGTSQQAYNTRIYSWHKTLVETGCSVLHAKSLDRPRVSEATVEQLSERLVRSPRKSTPLASRETAIPNVTLWRVLQRRLHLQEYKLSIVQRLTHAVKVIRNEFCMQMFHWI
jgi:hypothetical protein